MYMSSLAFNLLLFESWVSGHDTPHLPQIQSLMILDALFSSWVSIEVICGLIPAVNQFLHVSLMFEDPGL